MRKRIEVRFALGDQRRTAVTSDISETGLFVLSAILPKPGQPLELELKMPDGDVRHLYGRVARAQRAPSALAGSFPTGFGVVFTSHDDPEPRMVETGETTHRELPSGGGAAANEPALAAEPPAAAAPLPPTGPDPESVPEPVPGGGSGTVTGSHRLLRVLVVDEGKEAYWPVCELLERIESFRSEPERVSGGRAGLAVLAEKRHDVCFVWRRLGPEAGLSFLRNALDAGCVIPIILIGSNRDRVLETQALKAGAADVLFTSRLDAEGLEHVINAALERARASASLRNSRLELRELFDQAPCGYVTLDAEGRIVRANETLLSWLGYGRKELADRTLADLLVPATADTYQARQRALVEHGALRNVELDLVRKDGTILPAAAGASVVRAEGVAPRIHWCLLDITERRRAEAPLRRVMRSVETTQVGVTIEDLAGRILFANPAAAAMSGYAPEELIGKSAGLLFPPEIHPPPAERGTRTKCDGTAVRKDGTTYPVRVLSDVVTDPRGRPVAYVICSEDLSP